MAKWLLAGILFLIASISAYLAWIVRRNLGNGLIYAGSFAGGALLGAGLVHLLADSAKEFATLYGEEFPWPYVLCGLGCFLTHLIESMASFGWSLPRTAKELADDSAHGDAGSLPTESVSSKALESVMPAAPHVDCVVLGQMANSRDVEDATATCENEQLVGGGASSRPAAKIGGGCSNAGGRRNHGHHGKSSGLLLMVALSFHSFLEGISLGSAGKGKELHIFFAVLAHKGIAAFTLGVTWLRSSAKSEGVEKYALAMIWFASATPAGISMGISFEKTLTGMFVNALSSGTFLYIGLVEGCPGVKTPWLPGMGALGQVIAFGAGFACMAALASWS